MKKMLFLAFAGMLLGWPSAARAGLTMSIYQSGSNVLASASGTIDTTNLKFQSAVADVPFVDGSIGGLRLGPTIATPLYVYTGITSGPSSFGTGSLTMPTSGSGDVVGVDGADGFIYTPVNYISGTSISATDTWSNTTLAGLGLTVGTYTYTWGTGSHADSLVVTIGPATVPEPASVSLMLTAAGLGLGALSWSRRPKARR